MLWTCRGSSWLAGGSGVSNKTDAEGQTPSPRHPVTRERPLHYRWPTRELQVIQLGGTTTRNQR